MSVSLNSSALSSKISIRRTFDSLPKVRAFLESIGRNSLWTRKNYETGLVHFHDFLTTKYANDHSPETVLNGLKDNRLDVYELIDSFITYEVSKQGVGKLTPQRQTARRISKLYDWNKPGIENMLGDCEQI